MVTQTVMDSALEYLGGISATAAGPFVAIVGGAGISQRVALLFALVHRNIHHLLIGGAAAYTFLKADGFTVGKSAVENDMMANAVQLRQRCKDLAIDLLLPTDHQVVDSYEPIKAGQIATKTIPIEFTNAGHVGLDIGIETANYFSSIVHHANTIFWTGPMGVIEEPPFDQGTLAVARAAASAAARGAQVVVAGASTTEFFARVT